MISEAMMTLEIPQGILDAAHLSLPEVRRELADLTLWEFRQWLGLRRIEATTTSRTCRTDLDALRELGRLA